MGDGSDERRWLEAGRLLRRADPEAFAAWLVGTETLLATTCARRDEAEGDLARASLGRSEPVL